MCFIVGFDAPFFNWQPFIKGVNFCPAPYFGIFKAIGIPRRTGSFSKPNHTFSLKMGYKASISEILFSGLGRTDDLSELRYSIRLGYLLKLHVRIFFLLHRSIEMRILSRNRVKFFIIYFRTESALGDGFNSGYFINIFPHIPSNQFGFMSNNEIRI